MVLKATLKGKKTGGRVTHVKDANGRYVYQDIYNGSREFADRGGTQYQFQRVAGGVAEDKRSYSLYFKPWNIVVSTGIYISDVHGKVANNIIEMTIIVSLVIAGLAFIAWQIITAVISPMMRIQKVMAKVEATDMTWRLNISKDDELGLLSKSINSMLTEFHNLLTKLSSPSYDLISASDSLCGDCATN
ncbi:cache domain-containing protein [Psychromonas hadalis]|uniref:cache domain-containing protein n=1 Tax=Psychromonas hadalis TaxID=211669 RepID=UPI0003B5882F|nr:methyl-accepting chemotaxis protein [Psychromonas hadalis]